MYLVDTQLQVNWIIRATIYELVRENLDIIIKPPKGKGAASYISSAIAADDFLAPTTTEDGYVTYYFTPDQVGLWIIVLTDGTESSNTIYYEYKLQIARNDTFTQKFVRSDLLEDSL